MAVAGRDAIPLRFDDLPPGDAWWDEAFAVLVQLRPHLDRATFEQIHLAGARQGLTFTAAFDDVDRCVGLAGWRIFDTTTVVRKTYVDDLVVDDRARSTGIGAAMLAHLEGRARAAGCHSIELDSGNQRQDAHRFYRREGYVARSAHFAKNLGQT